MANTRHNVVYNCIKEQMGSKSHLISEDSFTDNSLFDSSIDYQKNSDDDET